MLIKSRLYYLLVMRFSWGKLGDLILLSARIWLKMILPKCFLILWIRSEILWTIKCEYIQLMVQALLVEKVSVMVIGVLLRGSYKTIMPFKSTMRNSSSRPLLQECPSLLNIFSTMLHSIRMDMTKNSTKQCLMVVNLWQSMSSRKK